MKTNDTLRDSQSVIDRPWWEVRRTLSGALLVVCAAFGALWFQPELRAVLWETLVLPLVGTATAVVRSDLGLALAFSTGAGLLIGRMMPRMRMPRTPGATA